MTTSSSTATIADPSGAVTVNCTLYAGSLHSHRPVWLSISDSKLRRTAPSE